MHSKQKTELVFDGLSGLGLFYYYLNQAHKNEECNYNPYENTWN